MVNRRFIALALLVAACEHGTAVPDDGARDAASETSSTSDAGSTSDTGSTSDAASTPDATSTPDAVPPDAPHGTRGAFVHLFEWKWSDVAIECERYLGPSGFHAVQVSPPSEHAIIGGYPWWQRYQTVGYSLAKSRSGTAAEFADMVRRCAAAGVGIYVDAVINHMTGQPSGIGSNGTRFTKYDYPGLYTQSDFHMPPCAIADSDYQNSAAHVRTCELLSLADLDTSSEHVRDSIARYLSSLVELGVRGFRIDAAKHIDPADLAAIAARVTASVGAARAPYYYFEVIDYGGEAIHSSDYLSIDAGGTDPAAVIEFKYTRVGDTFLGTGNAKLADLRSLAPGGPGWGLLPSDRAVVFVNNHDTQRASSIFYQNAPAYDLATVFMLAWPYGYPSILSSYAFDRATAAGRDMGPPSDAMGNTRSIYASGSSSPDCAPEPATAAPGTWLCEHRRPFIPRMIAFRLATEAAADVTNFWDDGANAIAFGRGAKGFVVINRNAAEVHRAFATGLPMGVYCDVFAGEVNGSGACTGARITVDANGQADIAVAPGSAVAVHVNAAAKP